MAEKKHISKEKSLLIEQEKVKDYLKNNLSEKLSQDASHAENDDFLRDAMEGLRAFSSTRKIHHHAAQLNKTLHKSIAGKRKTKPIRFSQIGWYVIAVVIVILLILLAFAVIWLRR